MSLLSGRRVRWAALGAIVGALTVGGIAWADIPDSGVIHGCYHKVNGQLRVIDIDEGQACNPSESALSWNQTGPTGPRGMTGPTGAKGATGPTGPAGPGLFAHVTADGTLSYGTASSASHLETGRYAVDFGQSISGCVAVVTPGTGFPSATDTTEFNVWPTVEMFSHEVEVAMKREDVSEDIFLVDNGFNLVVMC
jgi:hypothetical protein